MKRRESTQRHERELEQIRQNGAAGNAGALTGQSGGFPLTITNWRQLAAIGNAVQAIQNGAAHGGTNAAGIGEAGRQRGGLMPPPAPQPSPQLAQTGGGRQYMGRTATGGYAQSIPESQSGYGDDNTTTVNIVEPDVMRCGSCDNTKPVFTFRAVTMQCNHEPRDCDNCEFLLERLFEKKSGIWIKTSGLTRWYAQVSIAIYAP